ncbi:hypothetical protein ID866_12293 [Astraeus odoratus]|nr:hypothetical protein ID866_12293 [Astraeus odoratus]
MKDSSHINKRISLQAVQYFLWYLLLILCWQREEPSVPILLYP